MQLDWSWLPATESPMHWPPQPPGETWATSDDMWPTGVEACAESNESCKCRVDPNRKVLYIDLFKKTPKDEMISIATLNR